MVLGFIAAAYIDFIRNTPLIVQLFFITFGLPLLLGYIWPFWCHALLALTINFSGYFYGAGPAETGFDPCNNHVLMAGYFFCFGPTANMRAILTPFLLF